MTEFTTCLIGRRCVAGWTAMIGCSLCCWISRLVYTVVARCLLISIIIIEIVAILAAVIAFSVLIAEVGLRE